MDPLKQLSVSQQFKRADDDKHIYLLLNRLQPQPDLLAAYVRVAMADLAAVMRQTKTAKAKIMNYGSSASGLFMMGSDLDFLIRIPNIDSATHNKMVRRLGKFMEQYKRFKVPVFTDVQIHESGRVPMVTAMHQELRLKIDVNFTSHVGVNNNFLIKHLLTRDARIKPMIMLLKYYNKIRNMGVTNFNLYALVIFALQNFKQPLLPALADLLIPDDHVYVENRWNVRFRTDVPFEIENKQPILELLLDFFSFYARFDYTEQIVSPYMGKRHVVTRTNYHTFDEFHCDDHDFQFERIIMIQDFFVLCANVGSNSTKFQELCCVQHANRKKYLQLKGAELLEAFFKCQIPTEVSPV